MTERMIENRIKKLRELEAQQKELEAAAETIRAELKADLEEKGVDELKTKISSSAGRRSSATVWTARRSRPRSPMCTASSASPPPPAASLSRHEKRPFARP